MFLTFNIVLSISTASTPLGDYVQVRVVEEMLLKIKSSHKICQLEWNKKDDRVKMLKVRNRLTVKIVERFSTQVFFSPW